MWSDYFFYLIGMPEKERNAQIIMLIAFWICMICVKFDMGTGDNLVRDFEKETRTCLDGEEQIKREEREKDLEMER